MMEYDIHTVLDLLTLVATIWVIYELRLPLKDTYQADQDTVQTYYVVSFIPDAVLMGRGSCQGQLGLCTMLSRYCGDRHRIDCV